MLRTVELAKSRIRSGPQRSADYRRKVHEELSMVRRSLGKSVPTDGMSRKKLLLQDFVYSFSWETRLGRMLTYRFSVFCMGSSIGNVSQA